jgi:RimJ/RimL family protein N-acetyltransferase
METPELTPNFLHGRRVRLAAFDAQAAAAHMAQHNADSQMMRLLDSEWPHLSSTKQQQTFLEGIFDEAKTGFFGFSIRRLEDDAFLGDLSLAMNGIRWPQQEAFLGLGIYDREHWGQGYGTDAMRLALRYAFDELNLRRVSLTVFAYNERARRTYLRVGFREEGRVREAIRRDGQRWDIIYMGVLRDEWRAALEVA